ncbi:MAG TPA: FtsX-like permease family protein [Nevskiaceae bacterium]|nr:FtsX-like permease family protein [Nevskiaceae bacterium]
MTTIALAWRRLRRGWRSGELLVLAAAIIVAVAADAGVGVFSARVSDALEQSSADALGADRLLTSRDALPGPLVEAVKATGARIASSAGTASVVIAGEESSLASVKAVSQGYPLRGALRVAPEPLGDAIETHAVPAPGEAWGDPRLWSALKLEPGGELHVGAATLKLVASIEFEPDRGGGFQDLAPRLLINLADLPATQLVQPGSRVQYTLLVAGNADQLASVDALPTPFGVRRLGLDDARPEVRESLKRAGRFLSLAVLAAALLAGCAIAISAHRHAQKLRDEVALLKCLGASASRIGGAVATSLLLLSVIASVIGVAIGYAAQLAIGTALASMLKLSLPAGNWLPLAQAIGVGVLLTAGFALPPALAARRAPPVRVFQRAAVEPGSTRATRIGIVLAVAALLWLSTDDLELAGIVLGAAAGAALLLSGLAYALVAALKPLRDRGGAAWRFGLANIARNRGASIAQVVALGLALFALLLITLGRAELLSAWLDRLKPDAPNQFVVNVQPAQIAPLREFFAAHHRERPTLMPMARARLIAINGAPVTAETFDDPEAKDWVNREFNLSWTDTIGDDNKMIEGSWWGAEGRGHPWLSVDKYAIERLHLKLGDKLTMQLAEKQVDLTVHDFREVRWDSFKPNFFLLVPPGVIEDAPAQWITSFYLPRGDRSFVRELVRAFPNITVLDIDQLMTQVRALMDRLVRALELLFLFTLAAGLTVLLALMEGTREQRAGEIAVLRTLGARRRVVMQGLLAEYATLGLLAGTVGALLAQAAVWILALEVFELPYLPKPWLLVAGSLAGAIIVAGLAAASLRDTLSTPPRQVLQRG